MKKAILLSSLVLLSTLAVASEPFVDGTVKYGVDFKEIGTFHKSIQALKEISDSAAALMENRDYLEKVPVFVDVTKDNKKCIVGLYAIEPQAKDTKVIARVHDISCENADKTLINGWIYDESGNFGVKSLTAGSKVKIVFESEFKKDGEQLKKALNASTQVQKNTKN